MQTAQVPMRVALQALQYPYTQAHFCMGLPVGMRGCTR